MSNFIRTSAIEQAPAPLEGEESIEWVLGKNSSVRRISEHLQRVAETQCPVLVSGETGTGKEIISCLIHRAGPRRLRPFVPVNCAALTTTLAESQLFGHEKGAFTGAAGSSMGVFRAAHTGIVFLDEVGEMPLELQPKLLRVLQQNEVTPVGSSVPVAVDVQVIAATNRDLEKEVAAGRFREDLYYRLNMVELSVPPLRERLEDLDEFVAFFSRKYARKYSRALWNPSVEEMQRFRMYSWPGNIRQLAHVIEQSYVLDCAPAIPDGKPSVAKDPQLPNLNLVQLRNYAIRQALTITGGHKGRAARLLGIHANTLTRLLVQLKIAEPDHVGDAC
jgi:DNA-binding NtrC family response regulator